MIQDRFYYDCTGVTQINNFTRERERESAIEDSFLESQWVLVSSKQQIGAWIVDQHLGRALYLHM